MPASSAGNLRVAFRHGRAIKQVVPAFRALAYCTAIIWHSGNPHVSASIARWNCETSRPLEGRWRGKRFTSGGRRDTRLTAFNSPECPTSAASPASGWWFYFSNTSRLESRKSNLSGVARFFPRGKIHMRFNDREYLRTVVYFPGVALRGRPAVLHFDAIAFNDLHQFDIASAYLHCESKDDDKMRCTTRYEVTRIRHSAFDSRLPCSSRILVPTEKYRGDKSLRVEACR